MGIKKRKDITAVDFSLSEKSENFLKELSLGDPLRRFVDSAELPLQLSALKQVSVVLRNGDQSEKSHRTVELLLDAFCNLPAKNQLTKALSSLLAAICPFWRSNIFETLKEYVTQTCAVDITNAGCVRDALARISLLYDNFVFGDDFQDFNLHVLSFLSTSLRNYLSKIRSYDSPTEKNSATIDVLTMSQLLNKIVQKSMDSSPELHSSAVNSSEWKTVIHTAVSTIYDILMDDTFVTDCHTAAGMFFPLLIKWLNRENLLTLTSKYLIDPGCDADPYSNEYLIECLEGKNFSELPIQSRICLFHGILAVLDVNELAETTVDEKCFLVDSIGGQLLKLLPRVAEKNAKLVYSRTLVLLATKIRMAAESINEARLHRQLHGTANLPAELVRYSKLHWDDSIDVVRHQSRIIFEQVIECHLATAGKDPQKAVFLFDLMRSLLEMDWSLKAKYGPLSCLVKAVGASTFLDHCNDLPQLLIDAVRDQAIACHVSEFLEKLYTSHYSELGINVNEDSGNLEDGKKFTSWCFTWIDPILNLLVKGNKSQKSSVNEYIVPNLLRLCPRSLTYICSKLAQVHSSDDGQLGTLITCLKYAKSNGLLNNFCLHNEQVKNAFSGELLKQALCHTDTQIRLDAIGLICEHSKTTETVESVDLDSMKFFLSLNFSDQSPAFRQHFVAVMKKLFIRLRDSGSFLHRQYCAADSTSEKALRIKDVLQTYKSFFRFLCDLCFDSLHSGGSFPKRTSALAILSMLIHIIGTEDVQSDGLIFHFVDAVSAERLQLLIFCFNDTFEQNKMEAYRILISMPKCCLMFLDESCLCDLLFAGIELAQSPRPQDCTTAAYLLQFLVHVPSFSQIFNQQKCQGISVAEISNSCSLSFANNAEFDLEQNRLCLAFALLDLLQEQVTVATANLMIAAGTRPMYPTLHCIRYILRDVSYRQLVNMDKWRLLLSNLIDICFRMAAVVSSVVSNSSPEGNIPVELDVVSSFPPAHDDSLSFDCNTAEDDAPLDPESKVRLMPEYLVVCGWRSIKEVSLILGQLSSVVPLIDPKNDQNNGTTVGLLSVDQLHLIGAYFTQQLLESRHRGAFELAYAGFVQMTNMLWNCTVEGVHELPSIWLNEVMLKVKVHDPDDQLCSTRRSAGVPFYIQALVTTEPLSRGRRSFKQTMSELLQIASQPDNEENTAQVHARNILRALFRDTKLGEDVFPYIADGIQVAILGYKSPFWPVRNSSTLLFSSLMTRIFGVKPTKSDRIHRNFLTGRVFFSRFPSLFEFILEQMQEATAAATGNVGIVHLHPGLYPVLMILGHLCPSVAEGSNSTLNLEQLVPYLMSCAENAVYKIRQMAARAIVPLVPKEKLADVLSVLLQRLPAFESPGISQNSIHGLCLQVSGLLGNVSSLPKSLQMAAASVVIPHLKNNVWILTRKNPCFVTRLSFAEIVHSAVTASWTSDLDEFLRDDLIHLGISMITQSKIEIPSCRDLPDPTPIPGHVQFMCDIASLALGCFCDLRFYDSADLLTLVKSLLASNRFDLQIEAFQFIIFVFAKSELDFGSYDSLHLKKQSFQWDLLKNNEIQECLVNCEEIRRLLLRLVLREAQQSSTCLALAIKALKLYSQHLSSANCNQSDLMSLWNISEINQIVRLLASSPRDEVKAPALELISLLVPLLNAFVTAKEAVESKDILNNLCDFMDVLTQSYQNPEIRLAVCGILVDNALHLLIDVDNVLGHQFYQMWSIVFRLLQDEDCLVRNRASKLVAVLGIHPASKLSDDVIRHNIESSLALRLCLKIFISLHNHGYKSWLPDGISALLGWLLNDVEPVCTDEESIRLFDRGEMNTYRDELYFVNCIGAHLKTTTPKIVISIQQQQQQSVEATDQTNPLNDLTRQFNDLLDDSVKLHRSLASSARAAFVQNAKFVANSVELTRNVTAAVWLAEIINCLMPISETVSAKLAELKNSQLGSRDAMWLNITDVLGYHDSKTEIDIENPK